MPNDTSESIYLNNESDLTFTIMVEPTCEPYVFMPGEKLRIEFIGGKLKDNIEITIFGETIHIEERGPIFAEDFEYHGLYDHPPRPRPGD